MTPHASTAFPYEEMSKDHTNSIYVSLISSMRIHPMQFNAHFMTINV